jgi:hypothetical protein
VAEFTFPYYVELPSGKRERRAITVTADTFEEALKQAMERYWESEE